MGVDNLLEQVQGQLPLRYEKLVLPSNGKRTGLVVVDELKGFCTVGGGNLAPQSPSAPITRMVEETVRMTKYFSTHKWPMLVLLDTHEENKPEVPFPPHCIVGSGEEDLVPELQWLEHDENAVLLRKNCIDGFIGAIQKDGSNVVIDWVQNNNIQQILVVGICTDICVLEFVTSVLSAKNHGILAPLEEVFVYTDGCATYDLPSHVAKDLHGTLAHPQDLMHHMGLYFAKLRGARLVEKITLTS